MCSIRKEICMQTRRTPNHDTSEELEAVYFQVVIVGKMETALRGGLFVLSIIMTEVTEPRALVSLTTGPIKCHRREHSLIHDWNEE